MPNQEWLDLAKVNPEFDEVLKKLPRVPVLDSSIPELRQLLSQMKQQLTATQSPDTTGVKEEDINIPARDGYSIPVRIYSPEPPPSGGSALFVIYHGGGFCLGGLENEELNCRLFVQNHGCVVVNVDYRLAPEHPFPTPVNDCWDATKWAAENASKLKANPSKGFIVGGTSAGGNMAAAVALLARDEKLSPPLTGLCLLIPALMDYRSIPEKYKDEVRSYEQNKDAPILGMSSIDLFMHNYKADTNSTLYNIYAPSADHHNLPPTYLQVCGMDPLRDEALVFERELRTECNTKTKLDTYPGLPHGFWSFFPDMKCSREFVQDTVKGVGWLLQQV